MPVSPPARLVAARWLSLALLLIGGSGAGCCFNLSLGPREPSLVTLVEAGGEEVILSTEPALAPAAAAVRQRVQQAGFTAPLPMLSTDGRGLIVEDRRRLGGPLLVWDDWTSAEAPHTLEEAAGAQWISSRHFIFARGGEQWVAPVDELQKAALVDPAFDPLLVRAAPGGNLWCAALGNQFYIGDLSAGITAATTIESLPHDVRSIAMLEHSGIALVETADGTVTAWDITAARPTGIRMEGAIDWPWATGLTAPSLEGALLARDGSAAAMEAVSVIHDDGVWAVGGFGDLRISAVDTTIERVDGVVLHRSLDPAEPHHSRAPLQRLEAWRGIVWPPLSARDADALPYHALAPLPPHSEGVDEPGE